MSTLKLDTLSNKAGTASVPSDTIVSGTAKAWVSLQTAGGTVIVLQSFNVSSVTDAGVGQYTVNFTNAVTANYCVTASTSDGEVAGFLRNSGKYDSSGFQLSAYLADSNVYYDPYYTHGVVHSN